MSVQASPAALRGAARRHVFVLCGALAVLIACDATSGDDGGDVGAARDSGVAGDVGSARDGAAVSVVDDAGRTVTLARPARRVISMIPAQTEIVGILAGTDALIARTVWDEDPAIAHLPAIRDALTPSVEWLAAQRPDLVIAWPDAQSRDVITRLDAVGVPVYASRVESIAEIRAMIRRLGVLLGAEARADSVVRAIDAELDEVRAAVAALPRRSVLYLLSPDPPMAAGPGTFAGELITLVGGDNIFGDLRTLWPQVSLEEIVRRQPDVIIRPSDSGVDAALARIEGRSGWRNLRAVREGRVYVVPADLYNRAGRTVGEAARGLAQRIHGLDAGLR